MKVWDDSMNILKTPVTGDLDVLHLFYLVGIVLVSIFIWAMLMSFITRGLSAAADAV
jgi:hypothetical protein